MQPAGYDSQNSARKRAPKACRRCRRQKIRCTGSRPCEPCTRRDLSCQFDDHAQKILVTRGYISDLENRISSFERRRHGVVASPSIADGAEGFDGNLDQEVEANDVTANINPHELDIDPPQQAERTAPVTRPSPRQEEHSRSSSETPLMNPLAHGSNSYFLDTSGRPIYLGTSSNWSFGRRVLAMAHERVMQAPLPPENLLFEGKSYDLGWDGNRHLSREAEFEGPALPSADFAIYLINAVKFHCGQLFHLFEEENFMQQFSLFQASPEQASQRPNLWYIHYLLILAFGKAFVGQGSRGRRPPGAELFVHAMRLLPDFAFYNAEPIESIQVLCCTALYLQCLDFRGAAYRIIGQALRMALENGMHTEMRSKKVDDSRVQRCRKVWWTVYILDRQMSSLMGVPMAITDESISAELPAFPNQPQRSMATDVQIKLSRVLAQILNTVYGNEARLDKRFLVITKEALKSVANVTDQLNSSFSIQGTGPKASISRLSGYLHLLYHQCIVLTTRPILYSFLQARMEQADGNMNTSTQSSRSVRTLLQMCVESAQQMLTILSTLQDHGLLESFLPFDLDAAFTSSIALLMAGQVDASLIRDRSQWSQRSSAILGEMISRGNLVAKLIQLELQQLEGILGRLSTRGVNQSGTASDASDMPRMRAQNDCQARQLDHRQPSPARPPPYMASSQPVPEDFSIDEFNWHDGFTAEQLTNFADSMDIGALDWFPVEVGQ
ncbi:hypothetical protein, variant 1 [Exophiala sideris]|uniref:Zn(2)-C6 fungal-type domain-containing protein n=1 Tax=Exophiala sideris TaxID=1016849 RepID=A0A0D1ZK62_9EURO|nr:hypothetical protein, variant 1 [Exophiala sideris]